MCFVTYYRTNMPNQVPNDATTSADLQSRPSRQSTGKKQKKKPDVPEASQPSTAITENNPKQHLKEPRKSKSTPRKSKADEKETTTTHQPRKSKADQKETTTTTADDKKSTKRKSKSRKSANLKKRKLTFAEDAEANSPSQPQPLPEYSTVEEEEDGSKSGPQRAQWGGKWEFLMSCIAMSVGLGNIWRFPFTAYENGGGAFLIPYVITLVLVGRPMYYMEMTLGQFTSKGNVKMFAAIAPVFQGIGYGQLLSLMGVVTYYCMLMALTLHYFFNSFFSVLPWAVCEPHWTKCVNSTSNSVAANGSKSSSDLYFHETVLHEAKNIDNGIGLPDWKLTLCLFASWLCVFLMAVRGVKSSGKAAYFLALFPYVIMITILIKACMLPGAANGIKYFIRPQWDQLLNPKVWYAAVTQCFFSLNIGFGPIIIYSSYNDFHHNIHRDALIISFMDTFTSLLAGFAIFAILGNLADNLSVDIPDVVASGGMSLAFVTYPDAIAKFDQVPQLFAVLFFFMLFVLGIGSLGAGQVAVITVMKDAMPGLQNWCIAAGTCLVGFLIGLIYVTPGGNFMFILMDRFAGNLNIFIMTICEVIVVMWWYGVENLCLDMEYMLGLKVGVYWRLCWGLFTPILLSFILIYFVVTLEPLMHRQTFFPDSAIAAGWAILANGILQIPLWALWALHKKWNLGWIEAIKVTFSNEQWGPADPARNKDWREFKEQRWEERNNRNESFFCKKFNILLNR